MRHNIEFKNYAPRRRLRELVEVLIARLDRCAPNYHTDAAFLRLFIDENAPRRLYHVSLVCSVPGRMLAAQEERHNDEEAVREAFAEIERQLEKHKVTLSHSRLYKGLARREELRSGRSNSSRMRNATANLFRSE